MAHYSTYTLNTQGAALGYVMLGFQPALIEFSHTLNLSKGLRSKVPSRGCSSLCCTNHPKGLRSQKTLLASKVSNFNREIRNFADESPKNPYYRQVK